MANARRCDICGEYYLVPEREAGMIEPWNNTGMVRILKMKDTARLDHDVMHFDACDDCLQDLLDYILTQRANWEKSAE